IISLDCNAEKSSMNHSKKARPAVEQLEDRWVPATIKLIGGTLFISNPFVNSGTATVKVTATANNTFTVSNGSTFKVGVAGNFLATGPFAAVTLSPGQADTYGGNVQINNTLAAGSASTTVGNAASAVTIGGGLYVNAFGADDVVTLDGQALNVNGGTNLNLGD